MYVLIPTEILMRIVDYVPDALKEVVLAAANPVKVPPHKVDAGHIEVGEWNGRSYPLDQDVSFSLSSDGQVVWAQICAPHELPLIDAGSLERIAWRILGDANDDELGILEMARERATTGGWPCPVTIQDFLFWIEDEAAQQEAAEEVDTNYAALLRNLAAEIRELGYTPSPAPWG